MSYIGKVMQYIVQGVDQFRLPPGGARNMATWEVLKWVPGHPLFKPQLLDRLPQPTLCRSLILPAYESYWTYGTSLEAVCAQM
jgi:hypothetical protein